eukprot:1141405-Pelagomonas_calceolata.AAC.4
MRDHWHGQEDLTNLHAQFHLFSSAPPSSATHLRNFMNQADVLMINKVRVYMPDMLHISASAKLPPTGRYSFVTHSYSPNARGMCPEHREAANTIHRCAHIKEPSSHYNQARVTASNPPDPH